ncbi:alcohol dehydrogenase catalytic domain-containing protein [Kitasatospora sp. NPDC001683]
MTVREVPLPEPGPGELRIRVQALGLNRAEALFRSGNYLEEPKPLATPGYEAAGTVDAVGEGVSGFSVGDAVDSIPAFSHDDASNTHNEAASPGTGGWEAWRSDPALRTIRTGRSTRHMPPQPPLLGGCWHWQHGGYDARASDHASAPQPPPPSARFRRALRGGRRRDPAAAGSWRPGLSVWSAAPGGVHRSVGDRRCGRGWLRRGNAAPGGVGDTSFGRRGGRGRCESPGGCEGRSDGDRNCDAP